MPGHGQQHNLGSTSDHGDGQDWTSLQSTFVSSSGDWEQVSNVLLSSVQCITVCPSGNDATGDGSMGKPYRTVKHAVESITDATAEKPYVINVRAGIFDELPFTTKSYVFIQGGNQSGTRLRALSGGTPFITMGTISTLDNMTILGPTDSIALSGVGASAAIRECSIRPLSGVGSSGQYGILADGSAGIRFVDCNFTNCHIAAHFGGSSVGKMFECDYRNCDIALNVASSGDIEARANAMVDCVTGINLENFSTAYASNLHLDDSEYGLIAKDNSTFECSIFETHNPTVTAIYDIIQEGSALVDINSGKVNIDKISISDPNKFFVHFNSNKVGDEAHIFYEELQVGSPESGRESVFGEGDSYTRGLLAYTYNSSTSAYTDIADAVRSAGGSTFTIPNSADCAIYIGSDLYVPGISDYHKFFGIKMSLVTPQSGGNIVAEYYHSTSGWTEFNHMTAEGGGNYFRKADTLFVNSSGSYQVRFDPSMADNWTKNNDPSYANGNRYWIRFRITSQLDTAPVFEQWKLHSNRTEINADGFLEYMGNARPYGNESVDWSSFQDVDGTLGNQGLWLTTNCKAGFINNIMTQNDSVGTVMFLDPEIDTSAPLKLKVAVIPASTQTLVFTAYLNSSKEGDVISTVDPSSTVGEISVVQSKSVTAGQKAWFEFNFDISDKGLQSLGSAPETLWINIVPTTATGNIYGLQFGVATLRWRDGNHI